MPSRSSKKPKREKRDFSQVAFDVVARLTKGKAPNAEMKGDVVNAALDDTEFRKQLMREMGRRGGEKGGRQRAANLSEEQRKAIAQKAAEARWSKQ